MLLAPTVSADRTTTDIFSAPPKTPALCHLFRSGARWVLSVRLPQGDDADVCGSAVVLISVSLDRLPGCRIFLELQRFPANWQRCSLPTLPAIARSWALMREPLVVISSADG